MAAGPGWEYCAVVPRAGAALQFRWAAEGAADAGGAASSASSASGEPALAVRLVSFGDGGADGLQCAGGTVTAAHAHPSIREKFGADFVRAMHTCLSGAEVPTSARVKCSFGYSDGPDESAAGVPDDPRSITFTISRVDKERNWKFVLALDTVVPPAAGVAELVSDLMRFKKRAEDEARRRAAVEKNSRKLEEQLRDALDTREEFEAKIIASLLPIINQKKNKVVELQSQLSECQARLADKGSSPSGAGDRKAGRSGGAAGEEADPDDDSRTPARRFYSSEDAESSSEDAGGEEEEEEDDDEGRRSAVPAAPLPSRSVSMPVSSSEYLSLGSSKTRLLNGTYAMDQSSILLSSDVSSSDSDSDAGSGSESVGIKGLMPRRDGKLPKNATHLGGSVAQHHLVHKRSSSEPLPQGNEKKQKKKVTAPAESSDDDLPF